MVWTREKGAGTSFVDPQVPRECGSGETPCSSYVGAVDLEIGRARRGLCLGRGRLIRGAWPLRDGAVVRIDLAWSYRDVSSLGRLGRRHLITVKPAFALFSGLPRFLEFALPFCDLAFAFAN